MVSIDDDLACDLEGVVVGLLPVVLVDLVSLAQLSCAYGISGLFSGIGFIFGPPLAGEMRTLLTVL